MLLKSAQFCSSPAPLRSPASPRWPCRPPARQRRPPPQPTPATPAQPLSRRPSRRPPKPTKATPEQRAEVERLDPLGRAAFWAREVDIDATDVDARIKLAKALRALGRYDEAGADGRPGAGDAAEQLRGAAGERPRPDRRQPGLLRHRRRPAGRGHRAASDWRPVSLLAVALEQSERDERGAGGAPEGAGAGARQSRHAHQPRHVLRHPRRSGPGRAAAAQGGRRAGAGAQERQNLALVLGLEGRFDEAERLERQDLPPPRSTTTSPTCAPRPTRRAARTWDSLRATQ